MRIDPIRFAAVTDRAGCAEHEMAPIVGRWKSWNATGDAVHLVIDHTGKVIDRYRVRVDHDGGDEDGR